MWVRRVPAVLRRKQQEKGMKATEKAGETASNLRPRAAAAGVGVIRRCWRGHRAPSASHAGDGTCHLPRREPWLGDPWRSEERRVGKECRSRWWRGKGKK